MEAERGIASCGWGRSAYRAFSSTDDRYRERMSCMRKNGYHNGRIVNAGAETGGERSGNQMNEPPREEKQKN